MRADELDARTADLDALFRRSPVLATLGIELERWGPGTARVRLATRAQHANSQGAVHGGVLFALADAAFEVACNSDGRVAVALETTCHYTAAVRPGEVVTADAAELSRTRRTASYRIDLRGSDGDPRVWYLALAYRTDRWHLGAERWPDAG